MAITEALWTNVIERLDIKSVEEEKIQKGKLQKDICLQYIIDNNRKYESSRRTMRL